MSIKENIKLTPNQKLMVLAIFDDMDESRKLEIMKNFPDIKPEDKIAAFDKLRRNIAAGEKFFGGRYKATMAEYDDTTLFQNIIKMLPGVQLRRHDTNISKNIIYILFLNNV